MFMHTPHALLLMACIMQDHVSYTDHCFKSPQAPNFECFYFGALETIEL